MRVWLYVCHASMNLFCYASMAVHIFMRLCLGLSMSCEYDSVVYVTYEFFMCTSIGLTPRQERFKKGHLVWALLLLPNLNETLAKFFQNTVNVFENIST